jgi:hypothetical protein
MIWARLVRKWAGAMAGMVVVVAAASPIHSICPSGILQRTALAPRWSSSIQDLTMVS